MMLQTGSTLTLHWQGRASVLTSCFLLLSYAQVKGQASTTPAIQHYGMTSLPVPFQMGDTTFCKGRLVTIVGNHFMSVAGAESWHTTQLTLGDSTVAVTALSDTLLSFTASPSRGADTCLTLHITKYTISGTDTFTYTISDTLCFVGDLATVMYAAHSFCVGDTNPAPSISLYPTSATGSFCCSSGAPSFWVHPATGEIPLHPGSVGTSSFLFTTSHPYCPDTASFTVHITARQSSIALIGGSSSAAICSQQPLVHVDSATLYPLGGIFRSWTGLAIADSIQGCIAPVLSPSGHHVLWYIPSVPCFDSVRIDITILPADDPSFSYPPTGSFCADGPDPWPLITGTGGGTFNAVTTQTIVDPDGRLRLQQSGAGQHVIRYITSGTCPDSLDQNVFVYASASAAFTYLSSHYCTADTNPVPLVLGTPGGIFSSDTGLVVIPATGEIILNQSRAGLWNVTYTLSGSCQATYTLTLETGETDTTTSFSYPSVPLCPNGIGTMPLVTGDTIGTFVAGAGVSFISTATGQLNLTTMQSGGPYTIFYDIANRCALDQQTEVWVEITDNPTFSYPSLSYCAGAKNPLPDTIALQGGTFSEPTGSIIFADSITGEIDASTSHAGGPYIITYTTSGPCPASASTHLAILPQPQAGELEADPGSQSCEGQTVALLVRAGSADSVRWLVNGITTEAENPVLMLADRVAGTDTVTAILTNSDGCSDTTTLPISWTPVPHLSASLESIHVDASGLATIRHALLSDIEGTEVHWAAEAQGTELYFPAEGNLEDIPATFKIAARSQSPHTLGAVRTTLMPRAGGCLGQPLVLTDTIAPDAKKVFVPEVITPNGDGQNDTWMLTLSQGGDPSLYTMRLFNDGGGKVLEMRGLRQDFDGATLPDGVYWWVIDNAQGEPIQHGGLTIRRK